MTPNTYSNVKVNLHSSVRQKATVTKFGVESVEISRPVEFDHYFNW